MDKTKPRTARDTITSGRNILKSGLLDFVQEILRDQIAAEQSLVDSMKQELALLEKSNLQIRTRRNGQFYFTARTEQGRETGITGDTERIHDLARRLFLEETLAITEQRIHRLSKALSTAKLPKESLRRAERLNRFESAGLDLCRIIFTKEQNKWIDEPYSPNPNHIEHLRRQTQSGIWMRSKSEVFLGNTLEALGIPYRYEDIVRIHSERTGDTPFRDSYYADFKIPNFFGGINVHEHFGAFQIEKYANNALQRLNDYHTFTLIELPGRPLSHNEITWSMESDLHDQARLKQLFRRLLFPALY